MTIETLTVAEALEAIAAERPTPGGGAVAAMTAALAAATGRMVLAYSVGKKRLAAHEPVNTAALAELEALTARALRTADEDAAAYGRLNRLWTLDREDPERRDGWDEAVAGAIAAPRGLMTVGLTMLDALRRLPDTTNRHLRSDLAVAAILAEAAVRAAAWNVSINLPLLADEAHRSRVAEDVATTVAAARAAATAVEDACTRDE